MPSRILQSPLHFLQRRFFDIFLQDSCEQGSNEIDVEHAIFL